MPGLVACGRRWRVAGDDLVCPASTLSVARLTWTCVLCAYVAHVEIVFARGERSHGSKCRGSSGVVVVLFVLIFLGALSSALLSWLAYEASRGTMLGVGVRARVPSLVEASTASTVAEGLASCLAMYVAWAPKHAAFCTRVLRGDPFERVTLRTLATLQVVFLGLGAIAAVLFFDPAGSRRVDATGTVRAGDQLEVRLIPPTDADAWQTRCESLCGCASRATCGVFGGRALRRRRRRQDNREGQAATALQDIASLLAKYLGGLDVVASDVVAGLALLRARQRAKVDADVRMSVSRLSSSSMTASSDPSSPPRSSVGAVRARDLDKRRFACAVDDDAVLRGAADAARLDEAASLMDIAMGVYGWKLLSVMAPLRAAAMLVVVTLANFAAAAAAAASLSPQSLAAAASLSPQSLAAAEGLDRRALEYRVRKKAPHRRVVFATFEAEPNRRVPTAVVVDDARRLVVVACRGTLSLEDCLTDATAKPVPVNLVGVFPPPERQQHRGENDDLGERDKAFSFKSEDVPSDVPSELASEQDSEHLAHSGMLSVARHTADLVAPVLVEELSGQRDGSYEVVVIGHSLGAGVAALLTLLLRERAARGRQEGGALASARCVAFSPPGALVDASLAEKMAPFCASVVVGDDLVPRLGLKSLVDLRDDVLRAVACCAKHKRVAIASFPRTFPDEASLFYATGSPRDVEANRLADACVATLALTGPDPEDLATLVPPGTLYHLVRVVPAPRTKFSVFAKFQAGVDSTRTAGGCCFTHRGCLTAWAPFSCGVCYCRRVVARRRRPRGGLVAAFVAPRAAFSSIRIARRMLRDHLPWVVADVLSRAADDARTNAALADATATTTRGARTSRNCPAGGDNDHARRSSESLSWTRGTYAPPRPLFLTTAIPPPSHRHSKSPPPSSQDQKNDDILYERLPGGATTLAGDRDDDDHLQPSL
eukprot:CAMPEP_0118912694 /NCGR_PEP_ID=MMETSP1166-20130328/13820_1 /TAXON_ID=1104430 /ORGANISM="Chrysoreinhardia sp, Strain CCMP3193" /LENGTH=941 /DNA_ID=CAMNT_0006852215 /DNA_START=23 /DNA_END=2848 /DNA_ORIENTATION=-